MLEEVDAGVELEEAPPAEADEDDSDSEADDVDTIEDDGDTEALLIAPTCPTRSVSEMLYVVGMF